MSIIVETPFQNFTGLDGKPLTNGKVYIGAVGTDPTVFANQIPVFWDEALTIPASQPLATNAGYIVRFGTPARVWVATDYSISVKNASNILVYYLEKFGVVMLSLYAKLSDLASSAGSSLIGFLQSGLGAVLRTSQDKMREIISVKDFGAKGDGVTDDTAAIQAAIDSLGNGYEQGRGLYFPGGIYKITNTIYVKLPGGANMHLYSDRKATLRADVPVGAWVLDVDYSEFGTANFQPFSMTNITISDITDPYRLNRNGLRMQRVLASKFTCCEFNYMNVAVDQFSDSNLNHWDTCSWRQNNRGWLSTGGIANNNTFTNCQWRYHFETAWDGTGTDGNVFIGGDFEPDNASPVIIANGLTTIGTRVERNVRVSGGGLHVLVLSNNKLDLKFFSDGGSQPNPAYLVTGSDNEIIFAGSAYNALVWGSNARRNRLKMSTFEAFGTTLFVDGPSNDNVIETNGSIQTATKVTEFFTPTNSILSADLTTWTAAFCTVTPYGSGYIVTADGGGAAYIKNSLPAGTYNGVAVAVTASASNAAGQADLLIGNVVAGAIAPWPSSLRRVIGVTTNYQGTGAIVDPEVKISFSLGGASGASMYLENVRCTVSGIVPD